MPHLASTGTDGEATGCTLQGREGGGGGVGDGGGGGGGGHPVQQELTLSPVLLLGSLHSFMTIFNL